MDYKVVQLEPYVGEEELNNLKKVIENKWLTEGPFSKEFISLIQEFTGAKHVMLANNGTLALYLSLLGLGVGPGDEVIVPDFTFIASGSSVRFTGAKPVFVDISKSDLNIDASKIEEAITPRTKAIMPVHVYGRSANMGPILEIAEKHGIKVFEDAAQGFGVFYKGKHTGTVGDIGMISFFADKTITMGEGAVVLTNDDEIYEKTRRIRNQGRTQSGKFIHEVLGMNFRLTDLQCAVGVAQVKKFEEIKRIKLKNYALYTELLKDVSEVRFLETLEYSNLVPFRANILAEKKDELMKFMEVNKIQTRGFFYPLHKQPCFSDLGYKEEDFPVSNLMFDKGVSLPVFCSLKKDQIEYVCETIKRFYRET